MRFFAFLGGLLVLALVAALVAPSFIDWNQFKSRFESEASLTLGLPVKVKGQAGVRLLPLPSVTFTDIEIGASADSVPILIADSFKIDVELAPLLKGNVVVVDMQLSKPTLNVELNKSGQLDIPEFGSQYKQLQSTNVSLEHITISDALVRVSDARFNRLTEFVGLNATASAKSLKGPWRVDGSLSQGDEKYRVSVLSGVWQDTQQIRLNVDVEAKSLPYDLAFNGPLSFKDGVPSWKGIMKLTPMGVQDPDDLIAFRRPGREEAFPIKLESELEIVSGGANVPAFELNIGSSDDPYRLNGNGQAVFGEDVSFRLRAEGQQVNVERFSTDESTGLDFSQRLAIFRSFLDRIPQFEADGEINLYLPAVVAGDTVIREVGMDLRPAPLGPGWQISNLEAQLPGRTELRADGSLLLGDEFGYQGELILASTQPSGFAKWLGSEVSPDIRDLSAAGFSAIAHISNELVEFDKVELILNEEVLKGKIRRQSLADQRPSLVAKLEGDAVDFNQLSALLDLFASGESQSLVEGHDLDLDLKTNSMAISGLQANQVIARLKVQDDQLTISQLDIGDMDNAELKISGVIEGIGDQPTGRLSTRFAAANPAPFLDRMNKQFGPFPLISRFIDDPYSIRDSELNFEFEGQEGNYQLVASGRTGGSEIDARLAADDITKAFAQQRVEGKLIVVNNDASQLLAQLGIPVVALDGTGRAALRVSVSGMAEQGLQTESALTVSDGYLSAEGKLTPTLLDDELTLNGMLSLKGELQDIDQAILLSGLPIPGLGQGINAEFETDLAINRSQLKAQNLKGALGDSTYQGELTLDADKRPRPKITGNLSLSDLDGEAMASLVYAGTSDGLGGGDGGGSGDGANTSQPVLAGFDADIELAAKTVTMSADYPPAGGLKTGVQMRNGDVSLDKLEADWLKGKIAGEMAMTQSTTGAALNGQMRLTQGDLSQVSQLVGLPEGLTGRLTVGGTFETSGADSKSMLSQITASGSMLVQGGSISGIDGGAFHNLLAAADKVEDDELSDRASDILQASFLSGNTAFEDVEMPFTVASGSLRVNSFLIVNDAIRLAGSGKYDLTSQQAELNAKVSFDAGREVVAGAQPEFDMAVNVVDGELDYQLDAGLFSTYLGMRVSERREREFEAQRSEILERQRLQQVARIYGLKDQARRIAREERERIRLLETQQAEQRRREEARRRREEIERKRIEAEIAAAEKRAAREAALEAGRRERRQQELDLLREKAREAAERIQLQSYDDVEQVIGDQ
ncbi:MAG: AsmA-like C-terminal region-containing protein [Rhizobiaceae bacterium]